ncbi:MAG: serine/threonine-protein kinase, partial [Pseudomonadota bacterium]
MRVCPVCRTSFPPGANFCPADGQQLQDAGSESDPQYDQFLNKILDHRYRIESRLGQGGMGVVYAARHVVIDKPVAVKILRHEFCQNRALVERFIREARAVSRIGHPNIVDVTDFGSLPDDHVYFVMEFLVGVTLSQELRDLGNLRLPRVVDLSLQVCQALAAVHAAGIVHRDLKPENIFIVNPSNKTELDAQD